jgi:adenylate cyclase
LKTANLAIVFTDIKGFTERTSRQTLEENERLLFTHDSLLRPIFVAFNGRIVKSIGDAFLVTFESPTQAVLAGVAIQDRLWIHNRQTPQTDQIHVRVAVNVGEVRVESKDVFGEPVNIAARVEAITEAGEVYFTESVYLSMNKAEVPAEEVGQFELKGIPGKIRVFRVPHAPYRVEPAQGPAPGADAAQPEGAAHPLGAGDLPPFGNMGLSRVSDPGARTHPGDLRAAAAGLASDLVDRTGPQAQALAQGVARQWQRVNWRSPAVRVALALLAVLLVGAGVIRAFGGDPVDRAIRAAGAAAPGDRAARIQEAEALIAGVKDAPERSFRRGQLTLAIGRGEDAARRFADAAQAGSSRAHDALVDLLRHEQCEVRSEAASRLGGLKSKAARRPLERLAAEGGPGDGGGKPLLGGLFGCNSKDAATRALQRLE